MLGKTRSALICKLHAHRFSNLYILLRINHHSCFPVDFENLNHIAVTARHIAIFFCTFKK